MMVEDSWPQIHHIWENASDETSRDQNTELGPRLRDRNNEQDEAQDNIHARRNRIGMWNVIHDPVLHYSRNKADHRYQQTLARAIAPDELRAWVELRNATVARAPMV